MAPLNESHRFWGILVVAGGVIFAVTIILHPPLADPWDVQRGLGEIALSTYWKPIHFFMTVGLVFWLVGLAGCSCMFQQNFHILRVAVSLFIASLAKWILVASIEINTIPKILSRLSDHEDYALRSIGETMFTSALISSYSAMLLTWFSTTLLASYLRETRQQIFVPSWGFWGGWLGVAGIVAIMLLPVNAGIVAVATSGPSFLWTLLYGWRFASKPPSL